MIVADLTVTRCAHCGCNFGVPGDFLDCRRSDKKAFYCPNGHELSYKQSEAEKLRLERDRLQQRLAEKDDELKDLENRRRAALGQVTKLRNRVGNGVCPCCSRSFTNLRRHMATEHADFKGDYPGLDFQAGRDLPTGRRPLASIWFACVVAVWSGLQIQLAIGHAYALEAKIDETDSIEDVRVIHPTHDIDHRISALKGWKENRVIGGYRHGRSVTNSYTWTDSRSAHASFWLRWHERLTRRLSVNSAPNSNIVSGRLPGILDRHVSNNRAIFGDQLSIKNCQVRTQLPASSVARLSQGVTQRLIGFVQFFPLKNGYYSQCEGCREKCASENANNLRPSHDQSFIHYAGAGILLTIGLVFSCYGFYLLGLDWSWRRLIVASILIGSACLSIVLGIMLLMQASTSAPVATFAHSAPLDRRSEDIRVFAVIVAELELGNIERHIFGAHLVEAADDPAFEDRPEAFNRVGVDRTDNVFLCSMIHGAVLVSILRQVVIDTAFVGGEQADFMRDGFVNECFGRCLGHPLQNASEHDQFWASSIDLPMSQEDAARMEELGWMKDEDADGWSAFI